MQKVITYIFTDGACSGNPGPGGWAAVLWKSAPDFAQSPAKLERSSLSSFGSSVGQVSELSGAESATTNNRMEMTALLRAFEHLLAEGHYEEGASNRHLLYVLTDSKYLISGLTQWIRGWKARAWMTIEGDPVSNQDLWQALDSALSAIRASYQVEFCYVEGHAGHPGNERCDELAVAAAKGQPISQFEGPFQKYPFDLQHGLGPLLRGEREQKFKDPYYLSWVSGELQRHATWKECEMRVKGRAGAKFKKITRPSEEEATLKSWGLSEG